MRGIVYVALSELVIEKYGMPMWDKLLNHVKPASKGIYTTAEIYPDEEIASMVTGLSEITQESVEDLLVLLGIHTFSIFRERFPIFFQEGAFFRKGTTLKEFIVSVEWVIHVEVRKLYPSAALPTFRYEDPGPQKLIVYYDSPRQLCYLAIGLMKGASEHFGTPLNVSHAECLRRGDSHCKLEVNFS